jgi:hypothetical protein
MSVNPPNGLELSNLAYKATVEVLREQIFPMWPAGARQELYGHDWRVRFTGSPWDSKGHEAIMYVSSYSPFARVFIDLTSRIGHSEYYVESSGYLPVRYGAHHDKINSPLQLSTAFAI